MATIDRRKLIGYWAARLVLNGIVIGVIAGLCWLYFVPPRSTFGVAVLGYMVYVLLSIGDEVIDARWPSTSTIPEE